MKMQTIPIQAFLRLSEARLQATWRPCINRHSSRSLQTLMKRSIRQLSQQAQFRSSFCVRSCSRDLGVLDRTLCTHMSVSCSEPAAPYTIHSFSSPLLHREIVSQPDRSTRCLFMLFDWTQDEDRDVYRNLNQAKITMH